MKRKLPQPEVLSSTKEQGKLPRKPCTTQTTRKGLDPEMTKTPPPGPMTY